MRRAISPCQVAGIVVGVIVVLGIALNVPDLARYIKLKSM